MMGRRPCSATGWEGGVRTITFTGTEKDTPVCDINTRHDVRHFVLLKNLLAYETRIVCQGRITSKPRFIQFVPHDAADTEDEWTAECVLDKDGEHAFHHIGVLSSRPSSGDQIVRVNVEIDRLRQRGTSDSASLQITVTS